MARLKRLIVPALLAVAFGPAHAEPVTSIIGSIVSWLGTVGYAGITYGTYAAMAISAVATAHANSQAKRRAHQEAANKLAQDIANISDRTATRLQSDAPHVTIYGEPGRVGVNLLGEITTGAGAQWNHAILAVASHECDAITEVYVEDDPVQADENGYTTNEALIKTASAQYDLEMGPAVHVGIHLSPGGVDVADQWLIDQCNGPIGGAPGMWTADHRISGVTYIVFSYNRTLDRFNNGLPKITVAVRGKKVYDWRTGTTVYSRNPALCLADFLRSEAGYSAAAEQIDTDAVIAAANACDEPFYSDVDAFNHGNSVARYTCDGVITSDQDRDTTRQQIEDAMAGTTVQAAGVWRILAGAWSTPVLTLTDGDMLAPAVVVQTVHPTHRRYNGARGVHVNATGNGVSSDFTPYSNAVFLAADGRPKLYDLALPMVSSQTRCHQLARIAVERSRGGLTLRIQPKMLAWHLQPGDRIVYSNELLGIEAKSFLVTDWSHSPRGGLGLQIEEDIPEYYDLVDETRADPTPNSNLPNPFAPLPAPTGLSVAGEKALQGASTILRARVSWDLALDGRVLVGGAVRVQWRPGETDPAAPDTGEPWQSRDLPGDSTELEVVGLDIGQPYTVRVQFATIYVRGAWAWAGQVFTSEPPAEVGGLALSVGNDGIYARWLPPEGIDLAEWDRTLVGRGSTAELALEDVRFDGHATGANLGWFPAGDQVVWASHHSRAAEWSEPVSAAITIEPPATPVVSSELQGRTVALSWQDCRTTQPISHYEIALGATAETAAEIARAMTNSAQRVEATADLLYTYWVRAVDLGGNASPWGRREVMILPDFTDPTDISALIEQAKAQLQYLADRLAALQIRGAVHAESAVARAREKFGNDLTAVGTVIEQVREQSATDAAALASQLDIIASQFQASLATVQTEVTTLATAQSAQATQLVTLASEVGNDRAYFTSRIETLVDEDQAISSQLVTLSADFAGNQASVASELLALANADEAMASQFTGLESTVSGNTAAIATEASTRASQHNSQATLINGLTTRVGLAEANIVNEATTRSDQHNAQAALINTLTSNVGTIQANYVNQLQVSSTVNSAIGSNNSYLQSSVGPIGTLSASVSTQQTTIATLDGNLAAQHLLKTELVGSSGKRAIAGIKTAVSSSNGGTDLQSEVVVLADRFLVADSLSGNVLRPVFEIVGGVAYLNAARIKAASIDTLQIANNAVAVTSGATGTNVAQVTVNVPAGEVWTVLSFFTWGTARMYFASGTPPATRTTRVLVNGGVVRSESYNPGAAPGEYDYPSVSFQSFDTIGPGSHTVRMEAVVTHNPSTGSHSTPCTFALLCIRSKS